jgi:hypothetical protein
MVKSARDEDGIESIDGNLAVRESWSVLKGPEGLLRIEHRSRPHTATFVLPKSRGIW